MNRYIALIYPLISVGCVVLLWAISVQYFETPKYILPSPPDVFSALYNGFVQGELKTHLLVTLKETFAGYFIGCLLALLLGIAVAESDLFDKFMYPLLVGLQAMPKVALAPIILVWCGYGLTSKIVLVALICFFPLFMNVVNGTRRTDPELIEACRAFSASKLYLLFNVKIPSAAGEIFSGLQVAFSLALIGAIVGEFVSSQSGLGYLISSSLVNLRTENMFAALILLALIGVGGVQGIGRLQRLVVFWQR